MRPDIYIVENIGKGFLAMMAKPVSGEWIEDEFAGIAQSGVQQVVSLLEPSEIYEVGLRNEPDLCARNQMDFVSFPLEDGELPPSVARFADFCAKLHHQISEGKNTVVHCRAGIGRAGLIAAGVLSHCGVKEPLSTFEQISRIRGVSVPDTDEQVAWFVANYAQIKGC